MSKLKIGLSAVFTIILLSLFSAVAFAEGPTSTNPATGIYVGDINNSGDQSTHKTHGNFQNNTNSCANCHSTHNGEDEYLLKFQGTETDLCLSCHDGTMGFYNVNTASGAGVFNSAHKSSSMHNVGTVKLGAAPGAFSNHSTTELECSSCHNPHGSVNDRLLSEKVLDGALFAFTTTNGQKVPVAAGTKTINLELTNDPEYQAINDITGTGGLKITKSNGPLGSNDKIFYSQFCSACHDDFLAKRSTGRPGDTAHYTHTTNSSSAGRNCASCHYAHGSDVTILKDASGKTIADYMKPVDQGGKGWDQEKAEAYMKDVSMKGSQLKKYTNMAVCLSCHGNNFGAAGPLVRPTK
jgi:predicted CXXCH cytochrome family protein